MVFKKAVRDGEDARRALALDVERSQHIKVQW